MKTGQALAVLGVLILLGSTQPALAQETPAAPGPLVTIDTLDVPRYMGTWHEIAKYPNWFQKKCVAETQAQYSLRDDQKITVINRCRMANGEISEAIGIARPIDTARLKVSFAPRWLNVLPFVWGNYWIIDLDEAYQLVAISEPKREYLWILSRTPKVEPLAYKALLERLTKQGFDLGKLEETRQEPAAY